MIKIDNNKVSFNPRNEYIKKQYETALLHGLHRNNKTVKEVWRNINLLEDFTNHDDFVKFRKKDAIEFKKWLEKRKNKHDELLSLSTVKTILHNLRNFFDWLLKQKGYRTKLDGNISLYLNLSNNDNRSARATKEKPVATFDQLKKTLLAMPNQTDVEKRNKAIFAFLMITGVRANALISLKVKDFDPVKKMIWQDPRHVKTKFGKGIETRLIGNIVPEAEKVFLEWFDYITRELGFAENDPIFPKQEKGIPFISHDDQVIRLTKDHWKSPSPIRKIFELAFSRVADQYYHPHSFRKTLATWMLSNCTPKQMKAISKNLGHEHMNTTMDAYADMTVDEQRKSIEEIGKKNSDLSKYTSKELLNALSVIME